MTKPAVKQTVKVALGDAVRPVGTLTYSKDGGREFSAFAYADAWLAAADRFELSPDLDLVGGYQYRKPPTKDDSIFHFGFADTEPDGWGCRVIARDHAKRRKAARTAGDTAGSAALTEMDYLLGVDDQSRIGALRLLDDAGNFLRTIEDGGRGTPPLLELTHLIGATRAVELNRETQADLQYAGLRHQSLSRQRSRTEVVAHRRFRAG